MGKRAAYDVCVGRGDGTMVCVCMGEGVAGRVHEYVFHMYCSYTASTFQKLLETKLQDKSVHFIV